MRVDLWCHGASLSREPLTSNARFVLPGALDGPTACRVAATSGKTSRRRLRGATRIRYWDSSPWAAHARLPSRSARRALHCSSARAGWRRSSIGAAARSVISTGMIMSASAALRAPHSSRTFRGLPHRAASMRSRGRAGDSASDTARGAAWGARRTAPCRRRHL
jgi:hypothetical protein